MVPTQARIEMHARGYHRAALEPQLATMTVEGEPVPAKALPMPSP